MLRLLKNILLFVFLGIISPLIAQDSLKIMSYNLGGMKPGTNPQTRILNAIQYLKQLDPDIIGVQEINESLNTNGADNQAKIIADSLSEYFRVPYYTYTGFTHLSWYDQFNEYIGVISKYPIEESGYFQLVKGAFPRKVLWNHITTPLGKINFFNTHLDHKTADIRVQQVQQIINYISLKDTTSPAVASILTGDFNDVSTTPTITQLTNIGTNVSFIDTYHAANPYSTGYTIPSDAANSRIDYIFCRNTGKVSIKSSDVVMNKPYGGGEYCSDHLGVMTIFTKKTTEVQNEGSLIGPGIFELRQNYPNPFNPNTTIAFTITENTHENVLLNVYDMVGREVATLINKKLSAGIHSILWNASAFASGVYFYKLTAGKYNTIKHMVLIK